MLCVRSQCYGYTDAAAETRMMASPIQRDGTNAQALKGEML
jgi:hypothetical protein